MSIKLRQLGEALTMAGPQEILLLGSSGELLGLLDGGRCTDSQLFNRLGSRNVLKIRAQLSYSGITQLCIYV